MSFLGKKYKRFACENVNELVKTSNNEILNKLLEKAAPTFCFTKLDDKRYQVSVECDDKTYTRAFALGEECDMTRTDGSIVKVTFVLESDNILIQTIKQPGGKVAYFRREFGDKITTMSVKLEGNPIEATIYFKRVE